MTIYNSLKYITTLTLLSVLTTSPVWAQSLSNDAFVSAEITRLGQADSYTFSADAGELVFITIADVDNTSLTPFLRLFDPGSIEVASSVDITTAEIIAYEVLSTGIHTIIVQDSGADVVGKYTLHFARVPGANELGRLSNDTRRAGTLDLGDIDTLTFDAVAGDRVHLNIADKNNTSLTPAVRLYNPAGSLVASDVDISTATLNNIDIDTTGVWSAVINDSGSDVAGDYDLFFTRVPGANEKGLLPNDARRSAEWVLGDVDTWVFDALPGDRIHLSVADVNNTSLTPELLLYDPQGTLVASDTDIATAFISGYTALQSGSYTVVAKDSGADVAGKYELHFARAPEASEGGTLSGITAFQAELTLGDIDTFEFGASAGSTINLNVADVENTSLTPQVIVYGDDGAVVAQDIDISSATLSFVAPDTGFYTVVVQDSGLDVAGLYTLDFLYIGTAPPVRTRSVVIEPLAWHLLGVPGNTDGSLGDLFSGQFDLASYDDPQVVGGWLMYGFDATALDPSTGVPGAYYKLDLSEPVPQGTGFWFIHTNPSAVRVNLPITATDAIGTVGGGCVEGSSCTSTELLATEAGGWTMGSVPSSRVPSVSSFRLLTDSTAPLCVDGCTLETAADVGYVAPNGFFVYEPSSNQYRLRADTDSIAPWTGFWLRANSPAVPGAPRLLMPVR